jgi:uncharacterized protein with ParB-like and HNH nuclease domain
MADSKKAWKKILEAEENITGVYLMSYEAPITIAKTLKKIRKGSYLLPSIQREFVWTSNQIEMLFDSLMRGYPIGTFLFWSVSKKNAKKFQFYEVLRKFHEKDARHNIKVDLLPKKEITAILDGQQRLTSLLIGLHGTYAEKVPYGRWDNPDAFPSKKLYLDLLNSAEEAEMEYSFKFLTKAEAQEQGKFWFDCSKVISFSQMSDAIRYLKSKGLTDSSKYTEDQGDFALNTLEKLFRVINVDKPISYYMEESKTLDKVLQIFIRINKSGSQLSYSDLLLSIATSEWGELDAREVIYKFVDDVNKIGDGFDFNKDIVLKTCLVLSDLDVKFKVDNFSSDNMATIESNWPSLSNSFQSAVMLLSKLGFNRDNLIANNAIIPIAYYIDKNGIQSSIVHSAKHEDDRANILEWLVRVLLKGTFGGQPDSIYPAMRDLINGNIGKFPLKEIIESYRGKRKSITFSDDDIENLLMLQYGKPKTYCALSLLYTSLDKNHQYHQDHIHPKVEFTRKKLKNRGYDEETAEAYMDEYNSLSNLQLLQSTTNTEKNAKPFDRWLNDSANDEIARTSFLTQNHISPNDSLKFGDFLTFIKERKKRIRKEFIRVLGAEKELQEAD